MNRLHGAMFSSLQHIGRLAVLLGRATLAVAIMVNLISCRSHSGNTEGPRKLFLEQAVFIGHGLIRVAAEDSQGHQMFMLYSPSLRLLRRIEVAGSFGADFTGDYISIRERGGRLVTLQLPQLTIVNPRFAVRHLPNGSASLPMPLGKTQESIKRLSIYRYSPTSYLTELTVAGRERFGFCQQESAQCNIVPLPPCPEHHFGVPNPISLFSNGGYALITICNRIDAQKGMALESRMAYLSTLGRWKTLYSEEHPLADGNFLGERVYLEWPPGSWQVVSPLEYSQAVKVWRYDFRSQSTSTSVLRASDLTTLRHYAARSPQLAMAVLRDPKLPERLVKNGLTLLDAEYGGRYLYVRASGPSPLCIASGTAGHAVRCTAEVFSTRTVGSVHSVTMRGERIYYLVFKSPIGNREGLLIIHGGPNVYNFLSGDPMRYRNLTVVTPLYLGGGSRFTQFNYPDRRTFDPKRAADEVEAVMRDASERLGINRWVVFSESYGVYIAQLLAARNLPFEGYIAFSGLCSPTLQLKREIKVSPLTFRYDKLFQHMIAAHESGCEGFKATHAPVIGFVHADDEVLGQEGASLFASAIRAAPAGVMHVYAGSAHVEASSDEMMTSIGIAMSEIRTLESGSVMQRHKLGAVGALRGGASTTSPQLGRQHSVK